MSFKRKCGLPAIITSDKPAGWESCRSIIPNLLHAYTRLWNKNDFELFHYSDQIAQDTARLDATSIMKLAREIRACAPDRLIFTDNAPHPFALLEALAVCYGKRPFPPIFFHIFGDFTARSPAWLKLHDFLLGKKTVWICASERQVLQVSRFLLHPEKTLHYCPFPIDPNEYHFNAKARAAWRSHFGIQDGEFLVIYSGRMSFQKNVVSLTQQLAHFIMQTGIPTRFFVAGRFDQLGAPFFLFNPPAGTNFLSWKRCVEALPPEAVKSIRFLGHLDRDQLLGFYNAADCQVSLSLHHDEDFGMSPAEGFCCGTPAVLTSWGGYASFASPVPGDCSLVPVKMASSGLAVNHTEFHRALFRTAARKESLAERQARAKRYEERFSIPAVSRILHGIHAARSHRFEGFNFKLEQLATSGLLPPCFPSGPGEGTFYQDIYSAYADPPRQRNV